MKRFTAPGRFIMNRLPYLLKFMLVACFLFVPVVVTIGQYVARVEVDRVKLESAKIGLAYYQPIANFVRDVQTHRDLTTARLTGYTQFEQRIQANERDLANDVQALDEVNAQTGAQLALGEDWANIKGRWDALLTETKLLQPIMNFDEHTTIIENTAEFLIKVSNNAKLILDPEIDSYYLIDLITNDVPELTETIAQIRGYGTYLIASRSLAPNTLTKMSDLNGLVDARTDSTKEFYNYVFIDNSVVRTQLEAAINSYYDDAYTFLGNVQQHFYSDPESNKLIYVKTTDPSAFFDEASAITSNFGKMNDLSLAQVNVLIQTRLDNVIRERITGMVASMLALVVAVYLFSAFYQTMIDSVRRLEDAAEKLAAGEVMPAVVLENRDELGQVATSFNMVGGALVKSNQELIKRARELEVANALAREASRVKSHFLSTMSHELRTPMNAIVGFTDLMLTEKPGPLTAMQRTFLERTSGNNRRLLTLINDVLDLSRIEAGRMEIVPKPYLAREMIEHITAQTSSLFSQKNLHFETQVDAALPDNIIGDRGRVEQVIVNLLSNAAKFTSEGTVRLHVASSGTDRWSISVSDTGKGIAPHMQEVIFEPFRQVEGGTTREIGGSGLGLAISRELVQMMDGTLTVSSEIGKGSTFTINLPLISTHPAAHDALTTTVA